MITTEEMDVINNYIDSISERRVMHTYEYFRNNWLRLTTQLESEYKLSIDDYTNSLCTRDFLQKVINFCQPPLKEKIIDEIQPIDIRFITATENNSVSLLPQVDQEVKWWWFRIPLRQGAIIREELKNW